MVFSKEYNQGSWQWETVLASLRNKSCALVSSSAELLNGAPLGAKIDSHDIVVRVNFPPKARYAERVGSRTDTVISGYAILIDIPGTTRWAQSQGYSPHEYEGSNVNSIIADVICADDHEKPAKYTSHVHNQASCLKMSAKALVACKNITGSRCNMLPVPLSNSAWKLATALSLDDAAISTGWGAYHFLTKSCGCVQVYGFSTSADGHYWDSTHRAADWHDMPKEHDALVSTCGL